MGLELLSLCLLLAPAVLGWKQDCLNDNKPVGFGAQVTGGAGGKQVTPKNIDELKSYLQSKDKLIIVLDKEYDFTDSEGRATQTGCFFQKCGSGFQESLAHAGTCNGRPPTKVSFSKAGVTELVISSDKTIMGKGSIKGKGLRIQNAKNVIIRDITIHDINPQVIWAGDALAFYNAQNVWVHKVTFRNIGRQHLVSYQYANTGITVSSCFFDGTTKSSAYCDDHHFWMWLFWGTNDQITLINNRILNSAGRLPHAGGWGGAKSYIHLVGNEFQSNAHVGLEPYKGAIILSEGNKFINFKYPINPNAKGGALAMIDSAADAAQCEKYFGQTCKINTYSKSPIEKRLDGSVLAAFSKLDKTAVNGARAAACRDKLASSSEPTGKQSSKLKPHKKLASSSEPTGKQSSKLKPHKKLSSSSKPTGKRSSKRKQHKKLASSSKPTGKRSSKRKAHKKTG